MPTGVNGSQITQHSGVRQCQAGSRTRKAPGSAWRVWEGRQAGQSRHQAQAASRHSSTSCSSQAQRVRCSLLWLRRPWRCSSMWEGGSSTWHARARTCTGGGSSGNMPPRPSSHLRSRLLHGLLLSTRACRHPARRPEHGAEPPRQPPLPEHVEPPPPAHDETRHQLRHQADSSVSEPRPNADSLRLERLEGSMGQVGGQLSQLLHLLEAAALEPAPKHGRSCPRDGVQAGAVRCRRAHSRRVSASSSARSTEIPAAESWSSALPDALPPADVPWSVPRPVRLPMRQRRTHRGRR